MTNPLSTYSTSDLIYAYLLSSRFRSPWIYSPSFADARDPDIWEVVRRNTPMLAEILRRNNSVVRPWRVAPNYHASYNTRDKEVVDGSKRLAAIAHEGLSHCSEIDEARQLLSEAFFLGRKYAAILWEQVYTSLDGTPEMLWYLPYKIKDVDRRRVHWVPDWVWVKPDGKIEPAGSHIQMGEGQSVDQMAHPKGGYLKKSGIHLELFNTDSWRWERLSDEQRRNMVEYVYYDEEDRLGHGRGVLEAGFLTHYLLVGGEKKITEAIDRFANGVLIVKLDGLRSASTDRTNTDLLNAAKDLANKYRSEHYMVLENTDDVEIKETTGTGINITIDWRDRLIADWARLCNGSVRPAGHETGGGTGARAQAQTEEDTSEAFYQNDRNGLDHQCDRDLLGAFLYHNQDNIQKLGLGRAKRPKFTSAQIKKQSPLDRITVMSQVLTAGQPILKSEFYEGVELTAPGEDDEKVEPHSAMAFGGGQGMGFEIGEDGQPRKKPSPDQSKPKTERDKPE